MWATLNCRQKSCKEDHDSAILHRTPQHYSNATPENYRLFRHLVCERRCMTHDNSTSNYYCWMYPKTGLPPGSTTACRCSSIRITSGVRWSPTFLPKIQHFPAQIHCPLIGPAHMDAADIPNGVSMNHQRPMNELL